jgi:membrane protein
MQAHTAAAVLKGMGKGFLADNTTRMAAALSYYTILALPPLLILILLLAGAVAGPDTIDAQLRQQIDGLLGAGAGEQVQAILAQAEAPEMGRPLAAVIGFVVLLIGATGAFAELQASLNRIFRVQRDPVGSGVKSLLWTRFISFGMILVLAFLLLVSLVLTALFSAFADMLTELLPVPPVVIVVLNEVLTLALVAALFAALFRVLPDATLAWRDAWVGGVATALLFVAGKFLIGLYMGMSEPGEAYGAAGSLIVLLIWIYYSAAIVFLGAHFTRSWALERGGGIPPAEGAVRYVEQQQFIKDEG